MSGSGGSSFSRRSVRSRNVSESSETSWATSSDVCSAPPTRQQQRCCSVAAVVSTDGNRTLDRVKRKKRRKNVYDFGISETRKRSRLSTIKHKQRATLIEEHLIRLKLGDYRVPRVQLTRLTNHGFHVQQQIDQKLQQQQQEEEEQQQQHEQQQKQHKEQTTSQKVQGEPPALPPPPSPKPKFIVEKKEEKVEKHLQLPGLSVPEALDPKILRCDPVVKINKLQTDNLMEERRRLLEQTKLEAVCERKNDKDVTATVNTSDSGKCVERLTEKLETRSLNDNKCTKKPSVSNSVRRLVRISIDKASNDRLLDKVRELGSQCPQNAVTEEPITESQPENCKSLLTSSRRLKRYSLDQNNDKQSVLDSVESKSKCLLDNRSEVNGDEKHREVNNKEVKKYSKNVIKEVETQSQCTTDKIINKCPESSSGCNLNRLTIPSTKDTSEKQETSIEKVKVSESPIECSTKSKNSVVSKCSDKSVHLSADNNDKSEKSIEQSSTKLAEVFNMNTQDDYKIKVESHKMVRRKAADKGTNLVNCLVNGNENNFGKSVDEDCKKSSKRFDKKINECSKHETELDKKLLRKTKDESEKHRHDSIDNCANFVENFVEESEMLPDKIHSNDEVYSKNQTDNSRRSTRYTVDKNDKHSGKAEGKQSNGTENMNQDIDQNQSHKTTETISKCLKNSNDNNRRLKEF